MTASPGGPECVWRWASPMVMSSVGAGGIGRVPPPLAIIELCGDVDAALSALAIRAVATGGVRLARLPGVDELVVARPEPRRAFLFPHAGPMALAQIAALLERKGIRRSEDRHPASSSLPEGALRGPIERDQDPGRAIDDGLLLALSRLQSPMGVDILLEHARRGREESDHRPAVSAETARMLGRVLRTPTVAAIGPPNIGKSTLLNALAKRRVSIVADEPGTTRDHVGVRLNLAGLHVQYLDCPGWGGPETARDDEILGAAARASARVAADADLVLSCGDPITGFLTERDVDSIRPACGVLRVMLRADLGPAAQAPVDAREPCVRTSVHQDEGLEALAGAIVNRLISPEARMDPGIWRFWDA